MRILITGAAGRIGGYIARDMRDRHEVRGLDRMPMPDLTDAVVAELTDFEAVERAAHGMEAVLHLGGIPDGGTPWEEILNSNIIGTYNVFEAAHRQGVKRIAFASRAGMFSKHPKTMQRKADTPPLPDSYYSCSKVFAESLGRMYAVRFGMSMVSVRIGNCHRDRVNPTHPHQLTPRDAVRVFEQAVTHPGVQYEVVWGVSDSDWPLYDVDHDRRVIGYEPQDRSIVPQSQRK